MVIPFDFDSENNVTALHPSGPRADAPTPLAGDPVLLISPLTLFQAFGPRAVEPALDVHRRRRVLDLARGPNGEVLAWVDDAGERLPTLASSRDDILIHGCGCPDGGSCAHVVGLLLAIREAVARGIEPPVVGADDPRLTLLSAAGTLEVRTYADGSELDELDGEPLDFDVAALEADELDDAPRLGTSPAVVDHPSAVQAALPPQLREIQPFLEECPPDELRTALWDLAMLYAPVQAALRARQRVEAGNVAAVVAEAREEIERSRALARRGLIGSLDDRPPDYLALLDRLGLLRRRGEVKALAELGRELIRDAPSAYLSLVQGPTVWIQAALLLVIEALAASDLPAAEKAEWAVGAILDDREGILPDLDALIRVELDRRTWSTLATRLVKRVYAGGIPEPRPPEEMRRPRSAPNAVRTRLVRLAARLTTNAGDPQRAEALLTAVAHQHGAVMPLIRHLRDAGRHDEAIRWARAGLDALADAPTEVYDEVLGELRAIVTEREDWPLLAALWLDELLRRPSARVFRELRAASEQAGAWDAVRGGLLRYFQTGERAWHGRGGRPEPGWPLPPLRRAQRAATRSRWPSYGDLIEIAILEGAAAEALTLYRRWQERDGPAVWPSTVGERLATALAVDHPGDAADLWIELALAKINEGNVPAYQLAGVYLAEAGFARARAGTLEDWERRITALAEENKRKHQLRKILKEVVWQVAGAREAP